MSAKFRVLNSEFWVSASTPPLPTDTVDLARRRLMFYGPGASCFSLMFVAKVIQLSIMLISRYSFQFAQTSAPQTLPGARMFICRLCPNRCERASWRLLRLGVFHAIQDMPEIHRKLCLQSVAHFNFPHTPRCPKDVRDVAQNWKSFFFFFFFVTFWPHDALAGGGRPTKRTNGWG